MNAAAAAANAGRWQLPPYTVHQRLNAVPAGEQLTWPIRDYAIKRAWPTTTGKGVRVAVIDTGIDPLHGFERDMAGAVVAQQDFSGSRHGPADREGHGTHVAGIIGARLNEAGLVGVAPDCELLIGKALGDDGSGSTAAVVEAIDWAVAQGARVLNLSLGSPATDPALERAIAAAAAAGCLVVCAAGNSSGGVEYPARYADCLAISAVDKLRRIAPFSCRGPEVDLGAPGVEILSTFKGGGYAVLSGTSMAAPFVAGCLALRIAQLGGAAFGLDDCLRWLLGAADDVGQPGRDPLFGLGLPGKRFFETPAAPPPATQPPAAELPAGRTLAVRVPAGGVVTITGGAVEAGKVEVGA